jgi:hypothetical protein
MSQLVGYVWWVLVGGQFANPIYKQVFGDAISGADEGYIVIRHWNPLPIPTILAAWQNPGHTQNEFRRLIGELEMCS